MRLLYIRPAGRGIVIIACAALLATAGCGDVKKLLDPASVVSSDDTENGESADAASRGPEPAGGFPDANASGSPKETGRADSGGDSPVGDRRERADAAAEGDTPDGGGVSAAVSRQERVELSAGVALAQFLPSGAAMSFSVDYRFTGGGPDDSRYYFWVIERNSGEPVRIEKKLKRQGTLVAVVQGWRSRQGPFESYIVEVSRDGSRRPISERETLR